MKFFIRCAYCPHMVHVDVGAISVASRGEDIADGVKCPKCGSKFAIKIETRRKSKGAAVKVHEAKIAAEQVNEIDAAREINARLGALLLAMPGCTCASRNDESSRYWPPRADAGSFLSTAWSRGGTGAMIPQLPRHLHHCPCRDTEGEAEILAGTGAK